MTDDDDISFEWDAAKAATNVSKHGVTFEDATYVFDDPMRLEEQDRFSRGEYRSLCIGKVGGVILTVVFTEPEDSLIRIISARRATAHERKIYDASVFQP
jgi:hypothetical protein